MEINKKQPSVIYTIWTIKFNGLKQNKNYGFLFGNPLIRISTLITISFPHEKYILHFDGDELNLFIPVLFSYYSQMAHYLNWVIRMLTDAEMQMNAVERVVHYTELKVEKSSEGQLAVPKAWPHQGQIVFDNVALRYAANLEPAVRNINLHIKAGEKVRALLVGYQLRKKILIL